MGPWAFFRKHLGPSILMAIGVMVVVTGYASEAYQVWTAGLKPWFVQLCGFLIFVIGVVSLLYQNYQESERRFGMLTTPLQVARPERLEPAPIEAPVSVAPAAAPSTGPVSHRKPDRNYLPDSFATRFVDHLKRPHTDMQTVGLLKPHIDEWVTLEGQIYEVSPEGNACRAMIVLYDSDEDKENNKHQYEDATVHVSFAEHCVPHLERMARGETIKFDAQITKAAYGHIFLDNAELL
jgi:hypothetical protein